MGDPRKTGDDLREDRHPAREGDEPAAEFALEKAFALAEAFFPGELQGGTASDAAAESVGEQAGGDGPD